MGKNITNITYEIKDNNIVSYYYNCYIDNFVNNRPIKFGLAFNKLSYTLMQDDDEKRYLNTNSLIFNVEDNKTIYNVFKHNPERFTYQLNNILYINDSNNIHVLNYNPLNNRYFNIQNNKIKMNILNPSSKSVKKLNKESIYSYNGLNYSYLYSSDNKLNNIQYNNQGLYKVSKDFLIVDNKLEINVGKYNYNRKYINNIVNKYDNIIYNYSYNIDSFGNTSKYKNCKYTSELEFNDTNENIITVTTNKNSNNYLPQNNNKPYIFNNIFVKDTNYLIVDFTVNYKYKTVINEDYQYNRISCPINMNNDVNVGVYIKCKLSVATHYLDNEEYKELASLIFYKYDGQNWIECELSKATHYSVNGDNVGIKDLIDSNFYKKSKYILLDRSRSFIHNKKCKSINTNDNIINESCNISLYFNIDDKSLYNEIYNNVNLTNNLEIYINFKNILRYYLKCYIDIMDNQFKILYHNYNYGFNYDKHGDTIGILLLPYNRYNKIKNIKNSYDIIINNSPKNIETGKFAGESSIKKDLFINYDSKDINNILKRIKVNDINLENNSSIYTQNSLLVVDKDGDYSVSEPSTSQIKNLFVPKKLKQRNLSYFKNTYINEYSFSTDEDYHGLLNNIISSSQNNCGSIQIIKYKENVTNNYYKSSLNDQKQIFNNIYNYRKSGLLYGDLYVPCLQEYLMMDFFDISKYFNEVVYNQYYNLVCSKTNSREVRFLTNQFYKDKSNNNSLLEYSFLVNSKEYNNLYKLNLYDSKNMVNNKKDDDNNMIYYYNYVWPMFKLPDFSIINSNNYIISFNKEENCEYVDYYINNNLSLNINFKSYINSSNFSFYIFDENFNETKNIGISNYIKIDDDNDIYELNIYLAKLFKVNIFYICFVDTDANMNQIKINNKNYRILCKLYIKNEGN